jgi:hypothetical protein
MLAALVTVASVVTEVRLRSGFATPIAHLWIPTAERPLGPHTLARVPHARAESPIHSPGLYAEPVRHLSIADITAPKALQFDHYLVTSAQGRQSFGRAFGQYRRHTQ